MQKQFRQTLESDLSLEKVFPIKVFFFLLWSEKGNNHLAQSQVNMMGESKTDQLSLKFFSLCCSCCMWPCAAMEKNKIFIIPPPETITKIRSA